MDARDLLSIFMRLLLITAKHSKIQLLYFSMQLIRTTIRFIQSSITQLSIPQWTKPNGRTLSGQSTRDPYSMLRFGH